MEWKLRKNIDLPPEGQGKCLRLPDGQEVAIFRSEGKYYAISNLCTHEGGPLCEGELEGKTITCPWHGWQFDIATGKCHSGIGENVDRFTIDCREDEYYLIT